MGWVGHSPVYETWSGCGTGVRARDRLFRLRGLPLSHEDLLYSTSAHNQYGGGDGWVGAAACEGKMKEHDGLTLGARAAASARPSGPTATDGAGNPPRVPARGRKFTNADKQYPCKNSDCQEVYKLYSLGGTHVFPKFAAEEATTRYTPRIRLPPTRERYTW
jgi:hypothetical protein